MWIITKNSSKKMGRGRRREGIPRHISPIFLRIVRIYRRSKLNSPVKPRWKVKVRMCAEKQFSSFVAIPGSTITWFRPNEFHKFHSLCHPKRRFLQEFVKKSCNDSHIYPHYLLICWKFIKKLFASAADNLIKKLPKSRLDKNFCVARKIIRRTRLCLLLRV